MSDLYTTEVFLPVFIPESLLGLNVPWKIMNNAIWVFNEKIKEEPISVQIGFSKSDFDKMVVSQIFYRSDDLFLEVIIPSNKSLGMPRMRANLVGYVVMDKSTGHVEDLVIEGFRFEKAKDVEFEDVPI